MKHRIKVTVEREKRGLFGRKKKLREEKTVWVDASTYRELKAARARGENVTLSGDLSTILPAEPSASSGGDPPISLDEMILYDIIFDD